MDLNIEPLDRHEDDRGWVSEIYSGDLGDSLQNIHLGTMRPDAVRGNHVHSDSREWIVFHHPNIHVRWENGDEIIDAVTDEPSLIQIPSGIPHGFKNESSETVSFTAYRDTQYDEENPDVESKTLFGDN